MNRNKATVILPTYQEHQTAPAVVAELADTLTRRHELLVVDDSPTTQTTDAIQTTNTDVRVIHRQGNGLASAVLDGIAAATHDTIVVMDGDGQHPPSAVPDLLAAVDDGADIVVGSRHHTDGEVAADWPLHRRLISRGATALAWLCVPPARQTTDPMSGLFAARVPYIDAVRDHLNPAGYKILLEVLARAPVEDIRETGYTFEAREAGESTLGAREYVDYVRHLLRLAGPSRVPRVPVPMPQEGLDE